jgi:nucleoside-diphosphate-sugar epimerase
MVDLDQPVCVTGAGGFIGTHLTARLLSAGHRVRATVRDATRSERSAHLRGLENGSPERLEIVSADILVPGSLDEAVAGCAWVFHLAAGVRLASGDPDRDIVAPTITGTSNLLDSIQRTESVQRLAVVSSISSVLDAHLRSDHVYTEDDWNADSTPHNDPHGYAETLAERRIWAFLEELDRPLDLLVINPVFALGPIHTAAHIRSSPALIQRILTGRYQGCPKLNFGVVDVRDICEALVRGVERGVTGRFIVHAESLWMRQIAEVLNAHFGHRKVSTRWVPSPILYLAAFLDPELSVSYVRRKLGKYHHISHDKLVRELGIEPRDVRAAIVETAESLRAFGLDGKGRPARAHRGA